MTCDLKDLIWTCPLTTARLVKYNHWWQQTLSGHFCDSKIQNYCLLKSPVSDCTCTGFTAPLSGYDGWKNLGVLLSLCDTLLHCDVQRGRVYWKEGYKNPQSSAYSPSSLEGAKKQTWRQERRFGATWIWWLRLLSDYNVEEIQVNTVDRLEQRGYCGLQRQRAYGPLWGWCLSHEHTQDYYHLRWEINQSIKKSFRQIVKLKAYWPKNDM